MTRARSQFLLPTTALALFALASACAGGSSTPDNKTDASALDANSMGTPDAETDTLVDSEISCVGLADGAVCSDTGICIGQVCTPSRCGDSHVDTRMEEQCEDLNEMIGDGCTNCRFDCTADSFCGDGIECNGVETCSAAHVCQPGTAPANDTVCALPVGNGICNEGACVSAGCGNGVKDGAEDCDDDNKVNTDGCTNLCKFTCVTNANCDNADACDGVETCNVAMHKCVAGTAVTCNAKGCAGTCNPADGLCSYADADKDSSACDMDCNDADPSMFPGGYECKDTKDNDCNVATIDATAPGCECYIDTDKDGYAPTAATSIPSPGACPVGYTRTNPIGVTTIDCHPTNASVNPGQREYFPSRYCPYKSFCKVGQGSFDYNCDGAETSLLSEARLAAATCVGALSTRGCGLRSGWVGAAVPACGGKGTFRSCVWVKDACTGVDTPDHVRACR